MTESVHSGTKETQGQLGDNNSDLSLKSARITVITVAYNAETVVEETVRSVLEQDYEFVEYIFIDGASTDRTLDNIQKYKERLSIIVSEPDLNLYDAMNKGVRLATGEWLVFMNAGDKFTGSDVIRNVLHSPIPSGVDIIYSDSLLKGAVRSLAKADFSKRKFIHQSLFYRKSLHDRFGLYLVNKSITLSDYIFFCTCVDFGVRTHKVKTIISVYDANGVSSGFQSEVQRICFDISIGRIGRISGAVRILYFPWLVGLKNVVKSILRRLGILPMP